MQHAEITNGIIQLTANAEPNSLLFESMWPIPHGVSMNSYIVKGEKTAIVDGLCGWDGVPETLFKLLDMVNVDINTIDYVVINHMEPDHAGWLEAFKKIRPNFEIVTSAKSKPFLEHYMGITDHIREVKTGDALDLGNGKTLQFYDIPNVHWPETIATFEASTKTLMPCDAFGMFGSIKKNIIFDDQVTPEQMELYERETLRYYANIVAAFSYSVQKALVAVKTLDISIIAPGHGLVWRQNPQKIIDTYDTFTKYSKGPATETVTVLWGSMYGATEQAVQPLVEAIESEGVRTHVHRVPQTHISYVLQSIWESSGVAIGVPTYEYKMFPPMCAILDEVFKKKTLNRRAFSFGSYGWSGGAQKELTELVERSKCKWQFLEPIEFLGRPKADDLARIKKQGVVLAQQVKQWCAEAKTT